MGDNDRNLNNVIPHSAPCIGISELAAMVGVLRSGMIASGAVTSSFEEACRIYLGHKYARTVPSGKMAIVAALFALKIGADDEVILPSYVCHDVADAIRAVGATPIYCDIGSNWCVSTDTVARVMTGKTRAILAVHMFGIFCDIPALKCLGVAVIEDACQAFHPNTGQHGDIAVYSFHATKCLTAGEGGLVTTNNPQYVKNLEDFFAPRLDDIRATLGLSQLEQYPEMLLRRRAFAERYLAVLPSHTTATIAAQINNSMFFRFPLRTAQDVNSLQQRFLLQAIHVRRGVDALLHRVAGLDDVNFPQSCTSFDCTLSLPLYPALTDNDAEQILTAATTILV